ncbi:hypothetical protein TNCV_121061 [Trichonephila clavipes]|nr:hypothetical protein TNCV_121061 [Trichonephila clavipes]
MRTRCLKCGESHRTNECPIKDKIQNPLCINCNKTGHMANWSQCEEFPKRKLRKGETVRNRNTSTETNKTPKQVTPNLSFAAALSGASNKNSIVPFELIFRYSLLKFDCAVILKRLSIHCPLS